MIPFNNTEIAFSYKSDNDLKQAHRLFKIVGKPWLVQLGKKTIPIAFSLRLPITNLIKKTIFRQFCGGESIDDCDETIKTLYDNKVGTILDYSVEGQSDEATFDKTRDEIEKTVVKAKNTEAIPFAVFKMTGLARKGLLEAANDGVEKLDLLLRNEHQRVYDRVDDICKRAHAYRVPIFIDAEETWIQNTIDRIVESMMEKYNKQECIVYNTYQLYRHDDLENLRQHIEIAKEKGYKFGAKLVRGAYMEKERERASEKGYPSPINATKEGTDKEYNGALKLMMDEIEVCSICAGTHNEESSQYLADLMQEQGIAKDDKRVYFAQLLGMSDHISFNLAHAGYNVAKYVPYGPVKEVMPYLLRRADENTSVAGQTGRELRLISREYKRRRSG